MPEDAFSKTCEELAAFPLIELTRPMTSASKLAAFSLAALMASKSVGIVDLNRDAKQVHKI
jgi:hypothetical protein